MDILLYNKNKKSLVSNQIIIIIKYVKYISDSQYIIILEIFKLFKQKKNKKSHLLIKYKHII